MGTSTVSGPFRSANGFQELVNGQWVPVAGGGGGNPNDIVITGTIYPNDPNNLYGVCGQLFWVDTNIPMGDIQSSLSSGGKWSCFSGWTAKFYQTKYTDPNQPNNAFSSTCITSTQLANCVCELTDLYGGFYILINKNNECGGYVYPYPTTNNYGCISAGCLSTYIEPYPPSAGLCDAAGVLTTGASCIFPLGNSLSCPARILFTNSYAGQCGNPYPPIKYTLNLHFDRLIA